MVLAAAPPLEGSSARGVLAAAFCEACERVIALRVLLEDPRHLTHRQSAAVVKLLRAALGDVEEQLQATRPLIFAAPAGSPATAMAGIGVAVAGLRQVHLHLAYLDARWPLGTADLFARKLLADGIVLPLPTLCPTERLDHEDGEVSAALRAHLASIGLPVGTVPNGAPILTIATIDLLDPLAWPALLVPLAAALVDARGIAAQLRADDGSQSAEHYRRACVAGVAARLIGEPTFAACAARSLLARLSGASGTPDLARLAHACRIYGQPLDAHGAQTLGAYWEGLLQEQSTLGAGWGRVQPGKRNEAREARPAAGALDEFVRASLPAPVLAAPEVLDALVAQLGEGRPINALPPELPADFAARLDDGLDARRFYDLLPHANERPCSLAVILAAGWRYKVRQTYTLCAALMREEQWARALETLRGHVLERCALLQQSIEAAYVQHVFNPARDQ